MGQKRYPDGVKARIVRAILDGRMTYEQGVAESGAPIRVVRGWVNNFRQVAVMHSLNASPGTSSASPAATPTPPGTTPPPPKTTPPSPKPAAKPAPPPTAPPAPKTPTPPPPPVRKPRDL